MLSTCPPTLPKTQIDLPCPRQSHQSKKLKPPHQLTVQPKSNLYKGTVTFHPPSADNFSSPSPLIVDFPSSASLLKNPFCLTIELTSYTDKDLPSLPKLARKSDP